MFREFVLAFIPIFVAIDAIGVLPIFMSFTQGLERKERAKIIFQLMFTAMCLAIGFIFLGRAIFKFLGITIGDFMIAGGILLFCIAIVDIINPLKLRRMPTEEPGAVPLGTPLIVGPAVLTTSLITTGEHGPYITLASVITNIGLAGLIFSFSGILIKILGRAGSTALSKVTSLLLAAIAIMMIRKGFAQLLS